MEAVEIKLRAPEPEDIDRLFIWENDRPEAVSAPLSRHNIWEYVTNYNADIFESGTLRLMIADKVTGDTVGHADLYDFNAVDRRAGIAIYVSEPCRRRGYGIAALNELVSYASTTLGMHQLWAHIAIDNEASRALFVRAGFKPAGRLRSWLRRGLTYTDVLIFQRLNP